jgi:hypothetical protein
MIVLLGLPTLPPMLNQHTAQQPPWEAWRTPTAISSMTAKDTMDLLGALAVILLMLGVIAASVMAVVVE